MLADAAGDSYIAYASDLVGSLGVGNMAAGAYDILWFDVVNGAAVTELGIPVAGGDHLFPVPPGIDNELAAWIRPAIAIPEPATALILAACSGAVLSSSHRRSTKLESRIR